MKIDINTSENKILLYSNVDIENIKIEIYNWNPYTNEENIIYTNISNIIKDIEYWYSPYTIMNDCYGIIVKIYNDDILIKLEKIRLKIQKTKKQVLVLHSEVGIGDNLAATPTIKKISEDYNQKIIILTYIPFVFINNPYIDKIVKITTNSYDDILKEYLNDEYDVHHLFNLMNTNWRLVDHKQICAYNIGLQLKDDELDMEFYPDDFINIENLPEKFVCINPSETEPERTWGYENWQKLINMLEKYIPVVAIGKETYLDTNLTKKFSNIEIRNGLNLMNNNCQNTLSQAYHIISKSETFVTMNNGLYILSLCNLTNHITELATSWSTYYYRKRKGILNYNLDYLTGKCKAECLSNSKLNIDIIGNISILKSGNCYLNKPTYECHPTPEDVLKSILKKLKM